VRITQRAVALTSLQGLNRNLDAVGKLQQQLTSGKQISAPSDSPTGTNRAMQVRSEQAAVGQQARALSDAASWLGQTDSTLQQMLGMTRKVRDLTVQGLSDGGMSDASRQALATEVASLREGLIGLANTKIQDRPLFGGTTSGAAAYDATGTFVGHAGQPVLRRISNNEQVRVDMAGPDVFGPAGADLFAIVDQIATNLATSPSDSVALSTHLAALDAATGVMLKGVADVGTRAARVDRAQQINVDRGLALDVQLGETENIDLPNTIMRLRMQETGYEAALAATAKALQPTLLDFLR
jgi:flagellar hook-associated protein 3 FlgL